MRIFVLAICMALLAACASSGPATSLQANTAQTAAVDAVYSRWRTAVETADIEGYVSVLHPDVRMFPPGAPVVSGADGYAAFLKPVFASADYKIEVTQMPQVEVVGELAMAEYEYIIHLSLKDRNERVSEPGALTDNRTRVRYFDVLRKTDTGDWGVWRHTWRVMPE